MQDLQELLDVVVDQVAFDLGRIENSNGRVRTSYASRPGEVITAEEFRTLVAQQAYPRAGELGLTTAARVIVPNDLLTDLIAGIRMEIGDYINPVTDRIGHAFPAGDGSSSLTALAGLGTVVFEGQSSVESFAKALTRGATLLGAQKVTGLLSEWKQGKAISYRTQTILNTHRVLTEPVSSVEGVRIESLPLSTDQLPGNLPRRGGLLPEDYLGRVLLTINHSATPALFRPTNQRSVNTSPSTSVPGVYPDLVCVAMSLEADAHADVAFTWNDYCDLDSFQLASSGNTWFIGRSHFMSSRYAAWVNTDFATGARKLNVSDAANLQIDGSGFRAALNALADADSETRIAAARWLRSKDTSARLEDSFIDLRIALESLYLKDYSDHKYRGEMRFRLALYGGWHLGADLTERKTARKTLRSAYDVASGAVHSGHTEFTPEKQELLADAQALCRQGILKMLNDGQPDWDNLILGG